MKISRILLPATLVIGVLVAQTIHAQEVNVYSYRKPQLINPMFDAFTAKTGIKVNAVFAQKGMLERLQSEGKNTPADVVFTTDIGRLSDLKQAELTQSVQSEAINQQVPKNLRDPENHWFGLTSRARIIVASKDRVKSGEISNYEDLSNDRWKGRICTRSGKHDYNVALISMMISVHGIEQTENWLTEVKENLARKPEGNDRGQVKAIKEGVCDIAIINHYYMYQMVSDETQKPWAESVEVIFPNQEGRGTHMNISGMAMTRYGPHPENARALMEFLASDQAQSMYAEVNGEYPVKHSIPLSGYLQSLGAFKQDSLSLDKVAGNRNEASKMVDRVAYND